MLSHLKKGTLSEKLSKKEVSEPTFVGGGGNILASAKEGKGKGLAD